MFTGLITDTAAIVSIDKAHMRVACHRPVEATTGQSIAISGCCLTVVDHSNNQLTFDLNPETWQKTHFSTLIKGDLVNIEYSLRADQLLDGHWVSGHVDTTGEIIHMQKENHSIHYQIGFTPAFQKWVVEKGSIAVDGISLTINQCSDASLQVCVIPHTYAVTNLASKSVGDLVNLEFDMMAKFFEKQIQPYIQHIQKETI
ncbi:MAG: riboflavin synthase [Deltaproteobacteria bacterium]|nr:riboflavin synthase [Deltaproteobacteria bacterium]